MPKAKEAPPADDFETAVEEVEGSVQTLRKMRKWPLVPKGMHHGMCIKAELQEKEFEGHKNTVIAVTWELEETYVDEETKEDRHYQIRDSLSLFYGPKARLHKVFLELTGESPEPLVTKKKLKIKGEDYIQELFQFKAFEEMEAEILVKHKQGKADPSKTYANVESYSCDEKLQKKNAALVFDDEDETHDKD